MNFSDGDARETVVINGAARGIDGGGAGIVMGKAWCGVSGMYCLWSQ